jgi:hypothetical protein
MDIAEKTLRLKTDFDDVYEAGKKAEYDAFWDGVQDKGNRTNYASAFRNWGSKEINPKYLILCDTLYEMFLNCGKLDVTPNVASIAANGKFASAYNAFAFCRNLKNITFDILLDNKSQTSTLTSTFRYCDELITIKKLGVVDTLVFFSNTFDQCTKLENITIEGTIGQNGFDIHWSTLLSADSLKSIINALSTTTTGLTIKLPNTAQSNYESKYGSGSWATLTATRSNWSIAYA